MLVESATDIRFKAQPILQAIYPHLLEFLIQASNPLTFFLELELYWYDKTFSCLNFLIFILQNCRYFFY